MLQVIGMVLYFFGLGLVILSFFHSEISLVRAVLMTVFGYFITALFAPKRVNKKRR